MSTFVHLTPVDASIEYDTTDEVIIFVPNGLRIVCKNVKLKGLSDKITLWIERVYKVKVKGAKVQSSQSSQFDLKISFLLPRDFITQRPSIMITNFDAGG